jgi:hypothetical protein
VFAEAGMWARLIGRDNCAALVTETYSALKVLLDISPIIHNVREEPDWPRDYRPCRICFISSRKVNDQPH